MFSSVRQQREDRLASATGSARRRNYPPVLGLGVQVWQQLA